MNKLKHTYDDSSVRRENGFTERLYSFVHNPYGYEYQLPKYESTWLSTSWKWFKFFFLCFRRMRYLCVRGKESYKLGKCIKLKQQHILGKYTLK